MSAAPRRSMPAATLAFDRLAPEYDALTGGEIFRLLRCRTHAAFARRFGAGSRVLEVGCGTGQDTLFLASHGARVVACDPSEEMVSRSLRRLAHAGLEQSATIVPCGLQHLSSFLDAIGESPGFDGIVSNFGALNCIEDLRPLGALAHRYLRPRGSVVVGLMSPMCALEALYFTATRRTNLALRRRGGGAIHVPVAGVEVPTFYHRIEDVRVALGADMVLESVEGIGVAIPPPYLERRWQSLPASFRLVVTRLDALLARWPPFNRVGDHMLLQFAKRSADA
jgi:ubiquinone/menaquinone biosynthesis C-methylase UbiE